MAYLKQVIIADYGSLDAGFPPLLLNSEPPAYQEIAPLAETPAELGSDARPE
jgi:hypothetical protein